MQPRLSVFLPLVLACLFCLKSVNTCGDLFLHLLVFVDTRGDCICFLLIIFVSVVHRGSSSLRFVTILSSSLLGLRLVKDPVSEPLKSMTQIDERHNVGFTCLGKRSSGRYEYYYWDDLNCEYLEYSSSDVVAALGSGALAGAT